MRTPEVEGQPTYEGKGKGREVAQLCPTLRDPMDCSPPGSSVHGTFQARVLECVAIALNLISGKKRDKHIHIHLCKTYEIPDKEKNIYTDLTSRSSSR